jgi:hypothetical protein
MLLENYEIVNNMCCFKNVSGFLIYEKKVFYKQYFKVVFLVITFDMQQEHAPRTCCKVMLQGHADRTSSMDMRYGHVSWTCSIWT